MENIKQLLEHRTFLVNEIRRESNQNTVNNLTKGFESFDKAIQDAVRSESELHKKNEEQAKYILKCMEAVSNSFNLDPATYGKELLGLIDIAQDFYKSNVGEVARLKVIGHIAKTHMESAIEVLKECNSWMCKIDDVHSFDTQERIVSCISELHTFINPEFKGEEKKENEKAD